MESESSINTADSLLREIVNVKISNQNPNMHHSAKQELQLLRLTDAVQEQILETLTYIHGPDFKLGSISDYNDAETNVFKKYRVGQNNLVVRGVFDYSQVKDLPGEEEEKLKLFAVMRLQSYGFHESHCIEALNYCEYSVEDALYLLYCKYLKIESAEEIDHGLTISELLDMRADEKSSLESIYDNSFHEKIEGVWIIKLKLEYLFNLFHKKQDKPKTAKTEKQKEKCKNFLRGVPCKFGSKCRFSHEPDKIEINRNEHLYSHYFELELRFPKLSRYPYEAPMIFLKTNACLPPLMNLHISKRLYQEAESLALDGIPSVYTVTELLKSEDDIIQHLKTELDFIGPKEKLFKLEKNLNMNSMRPKHFRKGATNRDNKKPFSLKEIQIIDEKIIQEFNKKRTNSIYLKMVKARKKLPAWLLRNDILNSVHQSQVIVISGETGCGKSTQVPQFILDEWLSNYDNKHLEIICTQPRRISAIGVAERVSEERVEKLGSTVGYQIRLESKISSSTRLTFLTTGILLRRLEGEPTLPNVTHIIVDEVHERSEENDFLLVILKELLIVRPDLKIILMSATLNAGLFSSYFGEIPVINIPGRTFPVEQYFLEDILEATDYTVDPDSVYCRRFQKDRDFLFEMCIGDEAVTNKPGNKIKDEDCNVKQIMARYDGYSQKTCRNIFSLDPNKINYELIEQILLWIVEGSHSHPKEGTILVFLPGIAEITNLYGQLITHKTFGKRAGKFVILPLHSSLTSEEQAAIFKVPDFGERKIVLSTNLAETSITIDDCVFVIDTGKMKEKHFDPNRNMESLETVWVTQANALQRKGRAGRVMSGVCIHLYTHHRFKYNFRPQPIAELHRTPLERLILNIKVLPGFFDRSITDIFGLFIEPPSLENTVSAIKRLEYVGALDKNENLTALGHHLASLPVDVRLGKLMLYGAIFGCLDAALTMAAFLGYKTPFISTFDKQKEAMAKKMTFSTFYSDHITVLMAYKKFLTAKKKSDTAAKYFATENCLSYRTLITIADLKYQYLEFLVDIGFVPIDLTGFKRRQGEDIVYELTKERMNVNGDNFRLLSSILSAALYPNIVKVITPQRRFIQSSTGAVPKPLEAKDIKFVTAKETVFIHPSSVNHKEANYPSPYLVYQEKVKTSKIFFRDCTMVPIIPLVLFSGDLEIVVQNGTTYLSLENGWIMFQVEEHKIAEMIRMIRIELYALLEEKIKEPLLDILHNEQGQLVIASILKLISL